MSETGRARLPGHRGARRLIRTGVTASPCVRFTASDAHERHGELVVPADCVASATARETRRAFDPARRGRVRQ